jgi:hypothetical protein
MAHCGLTRETLMVGIYISIMLQLSLTPHRTSVCGLLLHSAQHEGSQNSVLFLKTYQNIGKPQLSYVDLNAAVMLHILLMMQMCPFAVQEEPSFWRTPH